MEQDLLTFANQPHQMVRKFDVVTELLTHLNSLAERIFGTHLVHLSIGVTFELRPAPFVQEQVTGITNHGSDRRDMQHAVARCKQRIDHVRIALQA